MAWVVLKCPHCGFGIKKAMNLNSTSGSVNNSNCPKCRNKIRIWVDNGRGKISKG